MDGSRSKVDLLSLLWLMLALPEVQLFRHTYTHVLSRSRALGPVVSERKAMKCMKSKMNEGTWERGCRTKERQRRSERFGIHHNTATAESLELSVGHRCAVLLQDLRCKTRKNAKISTPSNGRAALAQRVVV